MQDDNGNGYSRFTRPSNRSNGGNGSGAGGSLGAYVPPQNLEAEQSTLGAMLLERAAIEKAAEILEKDDFYRDSHQVLFEAITALAQRDEPVDLITVQEELKNRDKLEAVGGLAYLTALFDTVPTAANIEFYAKIVEEKAILRRLIEAALEIVGMARGEIEDINEVIDQAERAVFNVSQQRTAQYFARLSTLLYSVYDKAEELGDLKQRISGLSTGIHDFDMITSGLQNTDLIIIAARPSMGKCAKYDTLIDHPLTGERLTVEDAVRQRLSAVLNLSETGEVHCADIADWVNSGVQALLPCPHLHGAYSRSHRPPPLLDCAGLDAAPRPARRQPSRRAAPGACLRERRQPAAGFRQADGLLHCRGRPDGENPAFHQHRPRNH